MAPDDPKMADRVRKEVLTTFAKSFFVLSENSFYEKSKQQRTMVQYNNKNNNKNIHKNWNHNHKNNNNFFGLWLN